MSWNPNDLVSDADLTAYESAVLTNFRATDWAEKRRRALEDWLAPILRGQGYDLARLRTRFEPDAVQGFTASAYTNLVAAATDATTDDINLATVFATPANDVLYLGSTHAVPRALGAAARGRLGGRGHAHRRLLGGRLDEPDRHRRHGEDSGKPFSGGGAITWSNPTDWVVRKINAIGPYYWVRVTLSATPTSAKASQIGLIRRSALCAPATMRTLLLIMREAPTGGPGPWAEKAAWYESEADAALQRALPLLGGEFDTDASDQVSPTEAAQTETEVSDAPFRLERA
jgi:hypothetical protein